MWEGYSVVEDRQGLAWPGVERKGEGHSSGRRKPVVEIQSHSLLSQKSPQVSDK